MAAKKKKKIDGRTKEGRALMQKALAKAAKRGNAQAEKKLKKMVKTRAVKHDGGKFKVKRKKAGRPATAAHAKIAKKFPAGEAVAVKTREGIVGVVAHYIDDGKKVVIRRGIENIAETQIIVPTVKLRAASAFEIETLLHSLHLLEGLHEHWEQIAEKLGHKVEKAVESVQQHAAIDPAMNVVETVEQVQSEADLSDEAAALKIVEDVLKASQSDLVTDEAFPYSA